MPKDSSDQIKKKLNELDEKLSKLTVLFFSYHIATVKYLMDEGVVDSNEFKKYLGEAKKQFKQLDDEVEFWRITRDVKKRKGK
ncbi:MAG: hypothetical protein WCJ71_09400 [Candidatus Omnitrophota bacterium]